MEMPQKIYDLVVIGGGPAGLTATVYAVRKRLNVLLMSKDLGGKTNYHFDLPFVHDYQVVRGVEVVDKFKRELEYLDFVRSTDVVNSVHKADADGDGFLIHTEQGQDLRAKAVIVATGARGMRLGIPGEADYVGRGLYYSALSYAPHFIEKTVAVIGDGGLALRAAAELATVASHVHLVGSPGKVLDSPLGRKLKTAGNVTIFNGYHPTAIDGGQYADRLLVRAPDDSIAELLVDAIFIEQALLPHSEMAAGLVDRDKEGRIKVDARNCTSVPGIFAAGDVTDTYAEQVLVAVGEGAKAALSAYEYLLPVL
jgi:alkyl hydroperoxide reductase subunit F